MSNNDVEHVSCLLDSRPRRLRRQSSSSNECLYDAPANDSFEPSSSSIPNFPNTTYLAQQRVTNSQSFPVHTRISPNNRPNSYNQDDSNSPDPDDYYRPHPPALDDNDDTGVDSRDTLMVGVSGIATEKQPIHFQRIPSPPTGTVQSSHMSVGQYRSVSDSSYRFLKSESNRGPSALASRSRSRQPTFKDLVNKFNQNVDQILPLPSTPSSLSGEPSRAASPASPVDELVRSRVTSHPRDTRDFSASKPRPISQWNSTAALGQDFPSNFVSPPSRTSAISSTSLANLNSSIPRRPLFGELLSVDTSLHSSGYGIPSRMRRRGSEGSVPSPNPAFFDHLDPSPGLSPLTPTAWYLGQTPFLEAVNTGVPSNIHRRARSDLSGNWPVGAVEHPPDSHMAVSAPLQPGTPTTMDSSHSKSRIPISSRRLNFVSGADDLSPSKTNFSNRVSAQVPLPPKGISRLPKPSPKSPREVTDDGQTTFAMTPRGKRQMAHGRSRPQGFERGTLLEAYIAAPPSKQSPTLRSSRPRQPVSHTTSPTPRSKVVETVSNFQKQINRDRESRTSRPRGRRLPELSNVDFATRRQKIQQAFNRTVQENERKEEEAAELRRQVKAQEDRQDISQTPPPEQLRHSDIELSVSPQEDAATVIEESVQTYQEEPQLISRRKDSRTLPHLHIDTNIPIEGTAGINSEAHLVMMDSPTLGLPVVGTDNHESKSADVPPSSAVTSASNDTNTTALDPEPQADLSQHALHTSHRTLLNQIMQIRESSPSSSSCGEPDYSFSDHEDKESIPIILRGPESCESSTDSCDSQEHRDVYINQGQIGQGTLNRWSMSSWSSSLQNQESTDGQCDGSGDDLSQYQQCTEGSEVATQSCSAASSTPPSITGNQLTTTLYPNSHLLSEQKHGVELSRNAHPHPSAPSLAKLGRWDPKRMTQIYLEELGRGRGHHLPTPAIRAPPEPRPDERAGGRADSLTDDPVLVSRMDVPPSARLGHAASLVFRDDWEHASPSIADWMQVAANDAGPSHDGAPTPRPIAFNSETQPEEVGNSLGLAINVQSPQEVDSKDPRSPHDFPQPPGMQEGNNATHETSQVASTVHLTQPLSNAFPTVAFAPLETVQSTDSSEDSSLRRLDPTPSTHTLGSSATSLAPSSSELPSIEPPKGSPSPEQRRLKKRRHVIKELVDTEYSFGRDMKVVDDIYKGTSSSCLDLSSEDVKVLFGNSDQVVLFSMNFQDALKEAARSVYVMPKSQRWSSKRSARNNLTSANKADSETAAGTEVSELEKDRKTFIGQVFMAHITQMEKVYTDYLKNHDAANKKLQVLQRNPKVAIWLKECREWASDLTTAWDLDSLLVKPVQRILKYPLLLADLVDSTPSDHPDHPYLVNSLEEVTNISVRINEMKRRADLVGQVVGRKRKESDVRAGLSKAFGRRTEKLRQQVGLSDMFEDKDYDALSQRFGESFFQLQVVMRDVEMYTREVQGSMDRFNEFVAAIEGFVDVSQSSYAELEIRWRELKTSVREIMTVALPEHLVVVRKTVIDPMVTLLKLHEGPQRVMKKRDKRLLDYARFKSTKDRGDKPDKKTTEQGEQFVALNETLKDELPKLYSLTAKLMEACLKNFVQIQVTWFNILQKRFGTLIDSFPDEIQTIITDWSAKSGFSEAQVLSLGICNGSLLADTVNLVNFNTPSTGANTSSPRRPSTVNSTSTRVGSMLEDSPKVSHDFGSSNPIFQSPSLESQISQGRRRADSAISSRTTFETAEIPRSQLLQRITNSSSTGSVPTSNPNTESFPSLPRLSLDSPFLVDVIGPSTTENQVNDNQPTSPVGRYSGFFSSAMPMSDNPQENTPAASSTPKPPAVLFLAASIYEFNIDRARREAGYPYLTYVAGEIFDVIAEKGELWLAKNQDDPTHQIGWIWNKHFAKLST